MSVCVFVIFQERTDVLNLMNEQHLSEQNAETFKLKLEQDEETEKLRKVCKYCREKDKSPIKNAFFSFIYCTPIYFIV